MILIIIEPEIIDKFEKSCSAYLLKPYYNDDGNLKIELNKNAQKEILDKIFKIPFDNIKN